MACTPPRTPSPGSGCAVATSSTSASTPFIRSSVIMIGKRDGTAEPLTDMIRPAKSVPSSEQQRTYTYSLLSVIQQFQYLNFAIEKLVIKTTNECFNCTNIAFKFDDFLDHISILIVEGSSRIFIVYSIVETDNDKDFFQKNMKTFSWELCPGVGIDGQQQQHNVRQPNHFRREQEHAPTCTQHQLRQRAGLRGQQRYQQRTVNLWNTDHTTYCCRRRRRQFAFLSGG